MATRTALAILSAAAVLGAAACGQRTLAPATPDGEVPDMRLADLCQCQERYGPPADGQDDVDDAASEANHDVASDVASDAAIEAGPSDVGAAGDGPAEDQGVGPAGISGACVLHDDLTPIPTASHDNDGSGFRKLVIHGVNDVATLQERCTLDVYQALLPIYCLTGHVGPVTFEVVTYNADGSPRDTACAAGGCGPYSCGTMGACTIRDGDLPAWDAPDVGPGFVREVFPQAIFFSDLQALCTPDVFAALKAEYCAMNRSPVDGIQEEIGPGHRARGR